MKGKILFGMLVALTTLILLSEIIELIIYSLADKHEFFVTTSESYFWKVRKYVSLLALPSFAVIVMFGLSEIDKQDRKILTAATIAYIFIRIIVIEIIVPFDYFNIEVENYFTTRFYMNLVLNVLSFVVILPALYYVLTYKLNWSRQWMMFTAMIVLSQVMLLIHQIILVKLFNNNLEVIDHSYRTVMIFPTNILQAISVYAAFGVRSERNKILETFVK